MSSHITHINAPNVPGNPAAYSNATVVGNTVYLSGSIGIGMDRKFTSDTIEGQTQQSLDNMTAVLKASGCELEDVVKITIFLVDMKHYAVVNEIYAKHMPSPLPARSCFAVSGLPLGALIEVEAIAVKKA